MAVVGDAYVVVRAITDSVRGDIQRGFNGADRISENAGRRAGEAYNRGFSRGGGGRGTFFSKRFEADANRARLSLQNLIVTGNLLGPAIAGAVGAVGSLGGGLFSLASAAGSAGPALMVLPGIFTAVAQAAATLRLAFGGIGAAFSAGLQSSGGGGGGGGGVGRQAIDNAKQIEAAADAVADARKRLTQVVRENVQRRIEAQERLADANEAVEDAVYAAGRADRDYADAQVATRKAIEALSEARQEAIEDLQQLRFETEAAGLGEKKARLEFEKSRDALQRVQDLPPNSRARQEAELAFAEADLNLRRAIDKNADLKKEENAATKAGVDGSKKVIAAQDAIRNARRSEEDALRGVMEAQEAVTDARNEAAKASRNIAEVERENAERQKEAIEDLMDALDDLTEARKKAFTPGSGGGGGGGIDPFAEAMSKLSKEAQDFVRYLLKIYPEFKKLQASAGQELFPKLEIAIQKLVDRLFPLLNPLLRETGGVLGDIAIGFANVITRGDNLIRLWDIWKTGDRLLRQVGAAIEELYTSFLILLRGAGPVIDMFGDWLENLTENIRITLQVKEATGQLATMYGNAVGVVRQLADTFKNVGSALKDMFDAATGPGSGGQLLLDFFQEAAQKLKDFTAQANADGSLKQYFLDASTNAISLLKLVGDIVKGVLQLGANPAVGLFIEELRKAGPAVQEIGNNFAEVAPKLGEIVRRIAEILAQLSNSGALEAFYNTLLQITKVLEMVFGNSVVQKIIAFAAPIVAIGSALGTVIRLLGFFGKALAGTLGVVAKLALAMLGLKFNVHQFNMAVGHGVSGIGKLKAAMAAFSVSNPIMLAVTAITTALGAFMMAQMNAAAAVDELSTAMLEQRDNMQAATAEWMLKGLQENITDMESWNAITKATGITMGEYAVALAEGGDKLAYVQQRLDEASAAQARQTGRTSEARAPLQELGSAMENLLEVKHDANIATELAIKSEESLNAAMEASKPTIDQLKAAFEDNISALTSHERMIYNNELAAAEMEAELKTLESALDSINKVMSQERAQIKLRDGYRGLTDAVKENGRAILGTSEAADNNKEVVIGLVEDLTDRVKGLGLSPGETAVKFGEGLKEVRQKLIDAGFKKKDVDAYLKELGATPKEAEKILGQVQNAGEKAKEDFKTTGAMAGQGFIDGIRAKAQESYNAGVTLGQYANRGLQATLKIESPSRVMRDNGRDTVLGFVLGITQNQDKPANAFAKMIDKMVKDGGDKLQEFAASIKTVYENYLGTIAELGEISKSFTQDINEALNPPELRDSPMAKGDWLKEAQAAADDAAASFAKLSKNFTRGEDGAFSDKQIAKMQAGVTRISEALKQRLITALDGARAELQRWKDDAANFASSVSNAIKGGINLQDAFQQSQQEAADGSKKSMTDILKDQMEKTRTFRTKIKELILAGYSRDVIDQVIAQGVNGGTELATAILDSGGTILEQDKTMQAELEAMAAELGSLGYDYFFRSGTEAAQGEVDSIAAILEAQTAEGSLLNTTISKLAQKLARDVVVKIRLNKKKFDVEINVKRIVREIVVPPTTVAAAEGGIVNRPTYTLVGEAGPEAIIPLNKTPGNGPLPPGFGLGSGQINITVNPSAGMDEVELAKLVSRELAFQMRRGAA